MRWQKQIQRAVVVEIGDAQADLAGEIVAEHSGTCANLRNVPDFVLRACRKCRTIAPSDCTASRSRTPSLSASATPIAFTSANRPATQLHETGLPLVVKDVQDAPHRR